MNYLVILVLVCVVGASKLPTVLQINQCKHGEKMYNVGDKMTDNSCQPCFCRSGGQMACMIIDCMAPRCVDAVSAPNQCCMTCPNGANCYLPDKTIMSADKPHVMANGRVCKCPAGFGFGFGLLHSAALCTDVPKIQ